MLILLGSCNPNLVSSDEFSGYILSTVKSKILFWKHLLLKVILLFSRNRCMPYMKFYIWYWLGTNYSAAFSRELKWNKHKPNLCRVYKAKHGIILLETKLVFNIPDCLPPAIVWGLIFCFDFSICEKDKGILTYIPDTKIVINT